MQQLVLSPFEITCKVHIHSCIFGKKTRKELKLLFLDLFKLIWVALPVIISYFNLKNLD